MNRRSIPSGTTIHADPFGTAFETRPIGVDGRWHTWRVTWNQSGFYFWEDYVDGTEPYFSVPTIGIEDLNDPIRKWPFGDADYTMFPVLNLAVGGSGGGDPASGAYPADMLASAAIRALYTLPATTVLCRRRRAEFPYFRL